MHGEARSLHLRQRVTEHEQGGKDMKRSAIGPIVMALAIATASGVAYAQAANSNAFVNDLTIAGLAEVQLGKLAAERAANPDVKAFGEMMVKDHTQAANELKPIAKQLNVQQPTQLDQKHKDLADKLSKLQGSAFDREYIGAMVTGHEEVASKLRMRVEHHAAPNDEGHAAANGAGEQKLTQWAAMVLPTVQKHLDRARELQKKAAE
jgi:putative membrane protein